MHS
ncbi:hypothetical protein D030_0112A, partial [Vibrio parahaemolyticus AQ3810]|jgi:hypothetical protein